jgi:hypothetical protein
VDLPPALFFSHAVFFSNLPSALENKKLTYEKNKGAEHGARIDDSCVADRWRWHGRCGRRAVHKRDRAEARTEMTNAGGGCATEATKGAALSASFSRQQKSKGAGRWRNAESAAAILGPMRGAAGPASYCSTGCRRGAE